MTAAPALADVWADLVAGDVHAMQAIDCAMQRLGCDRAVALAALHGAAAEWLRKSEPKSGYWKATAPAIRGFILRMEIDRNSLDLLIEATHRDSEDYMGRPPKGIDWKPWCNLADKAIALCRSLAAVP